MCVTLEVTDQLVISRASHSTAAAAAHPGVRLEHERLRCSSMLPSVEDVGADLRDRDLVRAGGRELDHREVGARTPGTPRVNASPRSAFSRSSPPLRRGLLEQRMADVQADAPFDVGQTGCADDLETVALSPPEDDGRCGELGCERRGDAVGEPSRRAQERRVPQQAAEQRGRPLIRSMGSCDGRGAVRARGRGRAASGGGRGRAARGRARRVPVPRRRRRASVRDREVNNGGAVEGRRARFLGFASRDRARAGLRPSVRLSIGILVGGWRGVPSLRRPRRARSCVLVDDRQSRGAARRLRHGFDEAGDRVGAAEHGQSRDRARWCRRRRPARRRDRRRRRPPPVHWVRPATHVEETTRSTSSKGSSRVSRVTSNPGACRDSATTIVAFSLTIADARHSFVHATTLLRRAGCRRSGWPRVRGSRRTAPGRCRTAAGRGS